MEKGFSLIEMIAVVCILALITLVALPAVINQLKSRETDVNNTTHKIIFDAAELYMGDKPSSFIKTAGSNCYVYLDTLVSTGKLKSPIKDVTRNEIIPLTSYVKTTINNFNEYDEFELIEPNNENYTNVQEGCR